MAKLDVKAELSVTGLDKVRTLISLLEAHMSELPPAVVAGLTDLADCEECEIGLESIRKMGFQSAKVITDGKELRPVESVNKILKRITLVGKPPVYHKHASLVSDTDVVIMEW